MGNSQGLLPPPKTVWIRTETRGYFRTISWNVCFVLTFALLIYHCIKVYQDLLTKERKSIKHKPIKPELNKLYVIVIICATLTIISFFISTLVGFLSVWGVGCEIIFYFSLSFWEIGKGLMYVVFLIRLHTSFKKSIYKYNEYFLIIFGGIISSITVTCAILSMVYFKVNYFIKYEHLKKTCGALFPPLLTSFIALFDFVICFISVILFITPLYRLLSKLDKKNGTNAKMRLIKLASKYFILTTFAVITTVAQLTFMTTMAETTFVGYDQLMNCICVMMLLPYYPDNIYYDRLCCCFSIPFNKCLIKSNEYYAQKTYEMEAEQIASQTGTTNENNITLSVELNDTQLNDISPVSPSSMNTNTNETKTFDITSE